MDSHRTFAAEDQLTAVVVEKMLAGVATRRHTCTGEPVGADVVPTATSRRFVAAAKTALAALLAVDLSGLTQGLRGRRGTHRRPHCMAVALGIGADEGGLSAEDALLAVVDGGKALSAGPRRAFGSNVLI
ncbi:hypothetical protein ABIA31_003299 [Catenulispora sp. MAP5-51]|uniref:hypothetical protein n=1 Tax=Catenulispora sp. MAP5-51 TaxID=3156298 RepID=UPI003512D1EC